MKLFWLGTYPNSDAIFVFPGVDFIFELIGRPQKIGLLYYEAKTLEAQPQYLIISGTCGAIYRVL